MIYKKRTTNIPEGETIKVTAEQYLIELSGVVEVWVEMRLIVIATIFIETCVPNLY